MTTANRDTIAVYIHIPFCARRCGYCDFNAYVGASAVVPAYVDAVIKQAHRSPTAGRPASSVFFGGGTPSYLSSDQLGCILAAIKETHPLVPNAEISLEANPTSVEANKLAAIREAGFNRVSFGVQSFDNRLLASIDRDHSADEAEQAVRSARAAGFENISIDLMFGLPEQLRQEWSESLSRGIDLDTEHFSLYGLTIEPGTRFERLHTGGKLPLPHEDDQVWMYEHAIERLEAAGFEHYEISNFAKPGYRAQHNLCYWRNEEYLGLGAGATSYIGGSRWTNERHPAKFVSKVNFGEPLSDEVETLSPLGALGETLMVGLRVREGVSLSHIDQRFGLNVMSVHREAIKRWADKGCLKVDGDTLRLTQQGRLIADSILADFLET
jgi:oxygen-independent coproporphyrinogen-3 oxidase